MTTTGVIWKWNTIPPNVWYTVGRMGKENVYADIQADWFVEEVSPQRDYTLRLSFANGETRLYDAHELLDDVSFAPLRDVEFFLRAHRAGHSVVWSDEIDISPEYLFEKSVVCR